METPSKLTGLFMIKVWMCDLYNLGILKIIILGNLKFTPVFIHEFNQTFIEHLHAAVIYSYKDE